MKTPDTSIAASVAATAEAEHRRCMRAVTRVDACLKPGTDGRAWRDRLQGALMTMGDRLREHFSQEVDSALFQYLPRKHPRFEAWLSRLCEEHETILLETDAAIVNASEIVLDDPGTIRALTVRVKYLLARIRRHEAEESELVMQAHWDEIGTGD